MCLYHAREWRINTQDEAALSVVSCMAAEVTWGSDALRHCRLKRLEINNKHDIRRKRRDMARGGTGGT